MGLRLPWLSAESLAFPPTSEALDEPNGLLAAGGDLSPARLINAYRQGIFPWYSDRDPILWWSPNPRAVFVPGAEHCSRSMAKFLRRSPWRVAVDTRFSEVIAACATERSAGTWITTEMCDAYCRLHQLGFAHSFEVIDDGTLVGGIYGVSLGKVFFGESMFSRADNASKMALITLSRWLAANGFVLLDAQVTSAHITRLGAVEIAREVFENTVQSHTTLPMIEALQPVWRTAQGKFVTREGHLET